MKSGGLSVSVGGGGEIEVPVPKGVGQPSSVPKVCLVEEYDKNIKLLKAPEPKIGDDTPRKNPVI